ncbi:YccF family protein [Pseudochrobactrum asaccharolyticum]|nr:YccF family protein [Pseudochrobactrum asaccharolyticum]
MRFAGNVIWFVFGGAITALIWLLGAAVFAISIVGLPLTRSALEMAKMSAFPFGKDVVHVRELDRKGVTAITATTGTIGFIFNILWACTFGIVLFFSYIIAGIINCITIIGIPFGIQSFKLAGISLWPVGRRVVSIEMAKAVREENARTQLQTMRNSA